MASTSSGLRAIGFRSLVIQAEEMTVENMQQIRVAGIHQHQLHFVTFS